MVDEASFVTPLAGGQASALSLYAEERKAKERAAATDVVRPRIKLRAEEKQLFTDAVELWNETGVKASLKLLAAHSVDDADALARFVHARHSGLDKERLGEFFGGAEPLRQATFTAFLRGLGSVAAAAAAVDLRSLGARRQAGWLRLFARFVPQRRARAALIGRTRSAASRDCAVSVAGRRTSDRPRDAKLLRRLLRGESKLVQGGRQRAHVGHARLDAQHGDAQS